MQDGFDDARTNRSRFYLLVVRLATARFEVYGANEFSAASDSALKCRHKVYIPLCHITYVLYFNIFQSPWDENLCT